MSSIEKATRFAELGIPIAMYASAFCCLSVTVYAGVISDGPQYLLAALTLYGMVRLWIVRDSSLLEEEEAD